MQAPARAKELNRVRVSQT